MEYLLNFINETALEKIVEDDVADDQLDGLLDEIKMTKFSEMDQINYPQEEK